MKKNIYYTISVLILSLVFISCEDEITSRIYSTTREVNSWSMTDYTFYTSLPFDEITQEVIDHGAVLVYLHDGINAYYQLPFTYYPDTAYSETYEFLSYPGGVDILVTDSDHAQPSFPGNKTFKIVVIPANFVGEQGRGKHSFESLQQEYIFIEK